MSVEEVPLAHRPGIECSRCRRAVPHDPDTPAVLVMAAPYAPMDPGPPWRAAGDWAEPHSLAGTILCPPCQDDLLDWVLTSQPRIVAATGPLPIGQDEWRVGR